jgi:hypothetical protein
MGDGTARSSRREAIAAEQMCFLGGALARELETRDEKRAR